MKNKLCFFTVALLSVGLLASCNTTTAPKESTPVASSNPVENLNKENLVDNMYYQKLTLTEPNVTLDKAVEDLQKKSGTTERTSVLPTDTENKDTLLSLYAEEPLKNIKLYTADAKVLKQSDYDLNILVEKYLADATYTSVAETLNTDAFAVIAYEEANAQNQFIVWENTKGEKSFFALSGENQLQSGTTEAPANEQLNKENAVGNLYYQSVGIMYDETNIKTYVASLQKESGVNTREAIINTKVSDGNALIALYGNEKITDLALYAIDQEKFANADFDLDAYAKQYLTKSEKITVAKTLEPSQYAVIRCDEPEGMPAYMIAWKDPKGTLQYFAATYDGKGE